jgi:unsaturated chondroitin disaccharide hydrolase
VQPRHPLEIPIKCPLEVQMKEIRDFIVKKVRRNGKNFEDRLPVYTTDGKYSFNEDGGWVGGFWPGLNFLCYEMTGDQDFLYTARRSKHRFIKRLYENKETLDHDTGFLYSLSCVADYKLTGDLDSRKLALDSAKVLAERYNERGKFIPAWNVWNPADPFCQENRGRIIIDCMYNLPLLFWASKETGDPSFRDIAVSHADTCSGTIIREDYSTFHSFLFNPETGQPKYGKTVQGYSDDSTWSRGQSWAIGGYLHAFKYTGNEKYLDIAKNCAKVFINKLEGEAVPSWDFDVPFKIYEPKDTAASAIAAAGIIEMVDYLQSDEKDFYLKYAEYIVLTLYNNYSSKDKEEEGLLLHSCGNRPQNKGIDSSHIYADYFFVEAVAKLSGTTKGYW